MIVPHAEIRDEVFALYRSGGLPKGTSTGWPSVDEFYTVGLAQWTLVTGPPHSGKSEWVDALMVNLAKREPWRFWIYSPENWPLSLHHSKILEKYVSKPFNPGITPRMDEDDLDSGEAWMKGKFMFCRPDHPDIVSILDEAADVTSMGTQWKTGVVIDPWNQLDHSRPAGLSETEYISATLTRVIERVRELNIHLWLVAHPAKMFRDRDGKYPKPTPSDVSGSAHWWAKSDNCVMVWRDQTAKTNEVEIHIQKVRHKHIGHVGGTTLLYNKVTGVYNEKLAVVNEYRDYTGK